MTDHDRTPGGWRFVAGIMFCAGLTYPFASGFADFELTSDEVLLALWLFAGSCAAGLMDIGRYRRSR